MTQEMTKEEFQRMGKIFARDAARDSVVDRLNDAKAFLQSAIRDLERVERDLSREVLVEQLGGPEKVATYLESTLATLVGNVAGNFAWKLNVRYTNILKAVTPLG